jgi:choline dehydrogenase-like flavoprotein
MIGGEERVLMLACDSYSATYQAQVQDWVRHPRNAGVQWRHGSGVLLWLMPYGDPTWEFNGATQSGGASFYQMTITSSVARASAGTAFLDRALLRPNLRLETRAHVTRLRLSGRRVDRRRLCTGRGAPPESSAAPPVRSSARLGRSLRCSQDAGASQCSLHPAIVSRSRPGAASFLWFGNDGG